MAAKAPTLHTLKLRVNLAERTHAVIAAKAKNGALALKTRQSYLRKMPITQKEMLESRNALSTFIARQKAVRHF